MEPEEVHLMPPQGTGNPALGHAEVGSDADPDDDERGEDPEQERRFADGQPWQFPPLEKKPKPTGATAMNVQLDDFPAHRRGRVACRLPFTVAVNDGPSTQSVAHHQPSVARGTSCGIVWKRSS